MIKLLKIIGAVVILLVVIAVVKNVVNKRATEEAPLSGQAVLQPGDYIRDLIKWPNRPYDLHIPLGYDASRPTAVVLALHGGGADSGGAAKITCPNGNLNSSKCLNALADREGFVVVYPNGASRPLFPNIRTWNAGGGEKGYICVSEYGCENKIDDVGYFKNLLSELSKIINIDRSRVYATGISNGGAMSHRLACELSDWIVVIAAVGGGNQFSTMASCRPSQPVSVLQIHGTDDPAWPYNGGPGIKEGGNYFSVPKTISEWALRNGCSSEPLKDNMPNTANDGTSSVKENYKTCNKNSDVELIKIDGGGHTWPQGNQYLPERSIGRTSQDFNANETIWQFFKDHPRKTSQVSLSQNIKTPAPSETSAKETPRPSMSPTKQPASILTFTGPYIDATAMTDSVWNNYLSAFRSLKNNGFSHAGVKIWSIDPDSKTQAIISSRIADLRNRGFDLALSQNSGHRLLVDGGADSQSDPGRNPGNGQNLKYFDSGDFDAFQCDSLCGDCSKTPTRQAIDPAYNGVVWQNELNFIGSTMKRAGISSNDLVLFDTEVWGLKPDWAQYCYPQALATVSERYNGATLNDRFQQYYQYWRERGLDLKNRVKNVNSGIKTIFYGENIDSLYKDGTWMPPRTGDFFAPEFYFAPNLLKVQEQLGKGDFKNAIFWVSFSTTNYAWTNPSGGHPAAGWFAARWDSKVSQKLGYYLYQEGAAGAIIYPGPYEHDVPIDYYLAHAEAFSRGFLSGLDPGELTEICNDGLDNDGDGYWDENDCRN